VSEPIVDAAVKCPFHDGLTDCVATPEIDGVWKYYEGSRCGNTFGFERLAATAEVTGACVTGQVARAPSGPVSVTIGRRPE
jgi:hypothetical protein